MVGILSLPFLNPDWGSSSRAFCMPRTPAHYGYHAAEFPILHSCPQPRPAAAVLSLVLVGHASIKPTHAEVWPTGPSRDFRTLKERPTSCLIDNFPDGGLENVISGRSCPDGILGAGPGHCDGAITPSPRGAGRRDSGREQLGRKVTGKSRICRSDITASERVRAWDRDFVSVTACVRACVRAWVRAFGRGQEFTSGAKDGPQGWAPENR